MSVSQQVTLNGLDAFDMLNQLGRKNRRFQKLMLEELEAILIKDTSDYKEVRRIVLNYFNDYTRSVTRLFFEDMENPNERSPISDSTIK